MVDCTKVNILSYTERFVYHNIKVTYESFKLRIEFSEILFYVKIIVCEKNGGGAKTEELQRIKLKNKSKVSFCAV